MVQSKFDEIVLLKRGNLLLVVPAADIDEMSILEKKQSFAGGPANIYEKNIVF